MAFQIRCSFIPLRAVFQQLIHSQEIQYDCDPAANCWIAYTRLPIKMNQLR